MLITPVAIHPMASQLPVTLNLPMMRALVAIISRSAMTSAAANPLMTAAQTRALTGFNHTTLTEALSNEAAAIAV
jgi:hypothetical protein